MLNTNKMKYDKVAVYNLQGPYLNGRASRRHTRGTRQFHAIYPRTILAHERKIIWIKRGLLRHVTNWNREMPTKITITNNYFEDFMYQDYSYNYRIESEPLFIRNWASIMLL